MRKNETNTNTIGGATVPGGFYWNTNAWALVTVNGKSGKLPGNGEPYLKVSALAMLTVAPLMGGLYVMFLPFIGFALLAQYVGKSIVGAARKGAEDVAGALVPEMRPGEAYLTGKKDGKKGRAKPDGEVEDLEKEVAGRRATAKAADKPESK